MAALTAVVVSEVTVGVDVIVSASSPVNKSFLKRIFLFLEHPTKFMLGELRRTGILQVGDCRFHCCYVDYVL